MPSVFGIRPDERTVLFIDGPNVYTSCKTIGFDIDYRALLSHFKTETRLIRANYYTPVHEDPEDTHQSIRPLLDWLDYNGFNVVSKPVKEFTDSLGRRKVKGSMDIEIAVGVLELAPKIDHVVLFTGDGDFRSLVEATQRLGVRVTVVSSVKSHPPFIADELRRQADAFVDLVDAKPLIAQAERSVRVARPTTV